jgi:hypothetical protein
MCSMVGPQLVVLFWEAVETLGSGAYIEEVTGSMTLKVAPIPQPPSSLSLFPGCHELSKQPVPYTPLP